LPVAVEGERGKMGSGAALQDRHEKKAGGPREIVRLAEVRGARRQRRRMLLDLYELTLADGTRCRVHRKLLKKWDPTIRRLMVERHGLAITDHGPDGWRSESP
jgi:hypothetical protein